MDATSSLPPWPTVRAAILFVVIAVNTITALPAPTAINNATMRDNPAAEEELALWIDLLGRAGWRTDSATLREQVDALTKPIRVAREALVRPLRPWWRISGTGQGWGLFAYPDSHPHRLEVAVLRGERWETLYRSGDPAHAWEGGVLEFRRIRACYDVGLKAPKTYGGFVDWVTDRALTAYPDARAVRVRMVRARSPRPDNPTWGPEKPRFERIRRREDL